MAALGRWSWRICLLVSGVFLGGVWGGFCWQRAADLHVSSMWTTVAYFLLIAPTCATLGFTTGNWAFRGLGRVR